jgi:tetratricopeptide (TPR) repeat protein
MAHLEPSCPEYENPSDPGVSETSSGPESGRSASEPGVAKVRRPGQTALVAGLAVVVISIAGAVIYPIVREELARARMAAAVRSAPYRPGPPPPVMKALAEGRQVSDAPDKAETRTRLVVLRTGKDGDARQVVALGRPVGSKNKEDSLGTRQGILDRELIRQALLIAARDELGLPTRDELLDDAPPEKGEGEAVEIAMLFRPNDCRALFRRGEGQKTEILQKHDLGTNPDEGSYLMRLTALSESLSRSKFPALLEQLGLKGKPNPVRAGAPVPPDVENRLEQLGLVDNFAAIRALHETIRADGESPARLAALARAYAQLGVLTEYQWSPAHRAFKARALLYAERLLAQDPGSSWALRNRAFVRALVGLHYVALDDLAEANKRDKAAKDASPAPSWLPVIEAYLKNDRKRLEIKGGPHAKLAALLSMLAVEYPAETRVLVQAARDVVGVDADCNRAYDAICENGRLGDLHIATVVGPDTFTKLFPTKLKSLTALPSAVRQPLEKDRDELTLVDALAKAGEPGEDAGEPSWGVLAHLAREVRFTHVWRRLTFMAYKWAVPVDDYWADVQSFVSQHRYYPYLESIVLPPDEGFRALAAFADRYDRTDAEPTEDQMIRTLLRFKRPLGEAAWSASFAHCSTLARDFSERLKRTTDKKDHFGRILLIVSPYSAYAMATLVEHAWDQVKGEVPGWRAKVGDAPALLGALGKKYAELKQYDEAEKCLERYMEQSPDRWAYQSLAECYQARGNFDRWKATLDDFLTKTEDAGLEHARVQVQLANYYMSQKRWEDAKKYADPAAQTWAAWAMMCASQVDEGLKDWENAELWIRRTSERYPNSSWPDWYLFCKRTGHGDVEAARAFVEEYVAAVEGRPDLANPEAVAYFYWSAGLPKKALEIMDKIYAAEPTPLYGTNRMLLADELGDKARRDRILEELCATLKDKAPKTISVCQMIRDSLADGGKRPLDLAAVDKVLDSIVPQNRPITEFVVGKYLLNRRQPDLARKYLQHIADSPQIYEWVRIIAADALRIP